MARVKKVPPKAFESTGIANNPHTRIFESMMASPAFKDLSKNQRLLYIYMKAQYYGKRKPGKDFPEDERFQSPDMFYFNKALAIKYGLYTLSNAGQFYKDIKALIIHGFIEKPGEGNGMARKAIYQYSAKWKQWNDSS